MRRLWWVAVVVLVAAWWLWPYAGAIALANAAASGSVQNLIDRVDEPALKRSFARQIVGAYLRKSGRAERMGSLGRSLAGAVGASIAGPYLDQMLATESLALLLRQGHIGDLKVGDRTVAIDRQLPPLASLYQAHLGYVISHSYYDGIASFRFAVPADPNGDAQYGVDLRLNGLTWRLAGIDLPPDVLDRIAADAISAEKAKPEGG